MGEIFMRIVALIVIYIFANSAWQGIQDYQAAEQPLPELAKTEVLTWRLDTHQGSSDHKSYFLDSGRYTLKICEDAPGYSDCSFFMNKPVQGFCPAAAKRVSDAAASGVVSCSQSLGHRLASEPLIVAYNGEEVVSVTRANGEPVLAKSEWAEARRGYLQRKALWKIGYSVIIALMALCSL